ncbi:MAG TPA: Gfo/Idh/MocA family oxidoreductase, partial [Rectinema sp.]|nr:Gfo/Idh/MocA family oxidoreductase [Rectinema sp.]
MQNKVRFGMIGYGKVAALHAKALATIQHGELVSVCGHRQGKRDSFAYRWGLNSRNSVKEMVKEDAIQAVLITTPHPQHYSDALLALKAGCHVLVEKPLTLSVAEAETLISEANKRNLLLSVIAQR